VAHREEITINDIILTSANNCNSDLRVALFVLRIVKRDDFHNIFMSINDLIVVVQLSINNFKDDIMR
jgi:hypothetical protein